MGNELRFFRNASRIYASTLQQVITATEYSKYSKFLAMEGLNGRFLNA